MKYRRYHEYLRHPVFRAIRAAKMRMAGGLCEVCRNSEATEVHHKDGQYPPWGSFDSPSNMLAVCHQCHSKIHGKEN